MHSNCGYVSLVFARPTFIQKTVLLDRLIMAEAGDFFPDQSFGRVIEGIDAAMPSSDLRDQGRSQGGEGPGVPVTPPL